MIECRDGKMIWVCQDCNVSTDLSGVCPDMRCFICGREARIWFLRPGETPECIITYDTFEDARYDRSGLAGEDPSWPPPIDPS